MWTSPEECMAGRCVKDSCAQDLLVRIAGIEHKSYIANIAFWYWDRCKVPTRHEARAEENRQASTTRKHNYGVIRKNRTQDVNTNRS